MDQDTLNKVPKKVLDDLIEGARGSLTDAVLSDATRRGFPAAQDVIVRALTPTFEAEATERFKLATTIHELNRRLALTERDRDRYRESLLNLADELNRLGGRVHHESRQEYGYQL